MNEHINTYEEDLQEVTAQIEELQAKRVELIQTMLDRDANNLIGDICGKVYRNKLNDYFVIFRKVTLRDCPGFNYHGYSINCNHGINNFSVCNHEEVFDSKDDFNKKYEPVIFATNCVLFDLVDTFKNVNYEQTRDCRTE